MAPSPVSAPRMICAWTARSKSSTARPSRFREALAWRKWVAQIDHLIEVVAEEIVGAQCRKPRPDCYGKLLISVRNHSSFQEFQMPLFYNKTLIEQIVMEICRADVVPGIWRIGARVPSGTAHTP